MNFLAAQGDEGGAGDAGQEVQEVVTLVRTILLQIACRRDHIGKRQLNFHQGCRLTLRHKPFSPGISIQELRGGRAGTECRIRQPGRRQRYQADRCQRGFASERVERLDGAHAVPHEPDALPHALP